MRCVFSIIIGLMGTIGLVLCGVPYLKTFIQIVGWIMFCFSYGILCGRAFRD